METDNSTAPPGHSQVQGQQTSPVQFHASKIVDVLPSELGVVLSKVLADDSQQKLSDLVDSLKQEIHRVREKFEQVCTEDQDRQRFSHTEWPQLALDAFKRAERTRSRARINRIGAILANALIIEPPTESDEVEEMMRIAMDLADRDVNALKLVMTSLKRNQWADRLRLNEAIAMWKSVPWRLQGFPESEVESICSKLASFGLLARLDLPPNKNALTSEHNSYELLQKGRRFVNFIESRFANEAPSSASTN